MDTLADNIKDVLSSGEAKKLRADFSTLKEDFCALREDVQVLAKDAGNIAWNTAGEATNHLKAKGADALKMAKDKGGKVVEQTQSQIEQNPLAAVGIALGVGLAIGMLLCSGKRN